MWPFELVFTDVCHSLNAKSRLRLSLPLIALPISQGHTEVRAVSPIMGCKFDATLMCHHLHYCCVISSLEDTVVQFMKWWGLQLPSLRQRAAFTSQPQKLNPETSTWSFVQCTGMCLGSVPNKFAPRHDKFADSLTSLCVSTRQQGKGRKTGKKKQNW